MKDRYRVRLQFEGLLEGLSGLYPPLAQPFRYPLPDVKIVLFVLGVQLIDLGKHLLALAP